MKLLLLTLLSQVGLIMSAHAQGGSRLTTPSSEQKKQLEQATERLRQAQSNGELDKAKSTAQELLKKLPSSITDAAKAAAQKPEVKSQAVDAAKAAAQALMPQAQSLLDAQGQSATMPATAAPTAPAVQDQPPPAPQGPQPQALQPIGGGTSAKTGQPTVIIEADNSVFDLNAAIFIYTGHVRARHPDFYIECEELEVHMVKEEESKTGKKAPAPTVSSKDKKTAADSGIKKAIARGPMVTIEKRSEEGDVQQGKCRRLDYDAASGNITLSDYPQVQRGNLLHIATQADTTMVFDKNGKLHTNGRPRTVILSDEAKPASPNAQP